MSNLSIYVRSFLLLFCGIVGGMIVDRNLNSEFPIYSILMSIGGAMLAVAFYQSQVRNEENEQ